MATCARCGEQTEGAFCSHCGQRMEDPAAEKTQVVPIVPAASPQPPPAQPAPQTAYPADFAATQKPAGPPGQQPQGRGPAPYLIGGAVVLGVLLLGLVAFLAVRALSAAGGTDGTDVTPTPQVTVTATATASPPPPPSTPTPTANPTDIPTDSKDCGGGVRAIGPTSCQFALQVRDQYYYSGSPSFLPDVYSPITGETYDMRCTPNSYPVRCTGGNNAEVLIF